MFKTLRKLIAPLVFLILACQSPKKDIPYFLEDYKELYAEDARKAALQWFDDARLGMFIHWGAWAPKHSSWAMYYDKIPLNNYKEMAQNFDANGFDADAIVDLAKASGMNYITFVAKHHDGFALWDSAFSNWDSMDYPVKRDFVAELAKACKKQNMPLYLYYSIGIDWVHPYFIPQELYNLGRPHYNTKPDYFLYRSPVDFQKYREFCKNQLTELCTKYGDLAGFWFDPLGGVIANDSLFNMQEFYDIIHRYQPHALINFKTGITGTEDILVGERELKSISVHYNGNTPEQIKIRNVADQAWAKNKYKKAEIAVTSQGTWEWGPDKKSLPANKLYEMLEHAANNNANLLLNFGPKINGSIPEDVEIEFRKLGERIQKDGYPPLNKSTWMDIRDNGNLIDSTEVKKTAR